MPTEREAALPEPSRPTEAARLELARLPPDTPLDRVFALACELAANAIRVERVGIWFFVDGGAALRCASLFERSRSEHSSGAVLRVEEFPRYFGSLTIRKSVPAEVASADPRTVELAEAYLNPLGIASMLDAGIFLRSELVGVVCHEHVGLPRSGNAAPGVFDFEANVLALSAHMDGYRAARPVEADRVGNQVDQYLAQARLVGTDDDIFGGQIDQQFDITCARIERHHRIGRAQHLVHTDRGHGQADIARFEARGYHLRAMKFQNVSKEQAEEHYADLKSKPFFGGLVDYIVR